MKKDKNNHEIDLSKYQDPSGLSLDKMNFGLWLSENRKKITRLIIIFLVVVSAFFFIYSSYNYVVYFFNSPDDVGTVNTGVTAPKNIVSDLVASTPQIFKTVENYDFISTLHNPNDKFAAHFKYCFANDVKDISCSTGFILPSEEKYISSLGQKITEGSANISLKISDISWQRIDNHSILDWPSFAQDRLNFAVENVKLTPSSGNNEPDSLEFSITNKTNFSYYEVPLSIVFYSGSDIVGANHTIVKLFLSGETRNIRLSWPAGLSGVTRTDVRPELDLLNDDIYLKYQGAK